MLFFYEIENSAKPKVFAYFVPSNQQDFFCKGPVKNVRK